MSRTFDLGPLLAPRSIAIVGASESRDSWAPEIERSLRHVGYEGDLYPINPKYDTVWGRPCLSSLKELPRGVDLVVFVVPARVVVRMIDDCGAAGVRGIMVVSSVTYMMPLRATGAPVITGMLRWRGRVHSCNPLLAS